MENNILIITQNVTTFLNAICTLEYLNREIGGATVDVCINEYYGDSNLHNGLKTFITLFWQEYKSRNMLNEIEIGFSEFTEKYYTEIICPSSGDPRIYDFICDRQSLSRISLYEEGASDYTWCKLFFNIGSSARRFIWYPNNVYPYFFDEQDIQLCKSKYVEEATNQIYSKEISGICKDLMNENKKHLLLCTSPLEEDFLLNVNDRVSNFIQDKYADYSIIIKPHPRDITDYSKVFPGAKVLNRIIPADFLIDRIVNCNIDLPIFFTFPSTSILNKDYRQTQILLFAELDLIYSEINLDLFRKFAKKYI